LNADWVRSMNNVEGVNSHPILESFAMEGLNGYKNISINFNHSVKIVAAENGSGKTTLLNALNAILTRNFHKINEYDFVKLKIKFKDTEVIELNKTDVDFTGEDISDQPVTSMLLNVGLELDEIRKALDGFSELSPSEWRRTPIYRALYDEGPWDHNDTYQQLVELSEQIKSTTPTIDEISKKVKLALGGAKIMYLPTYRRIEAQLPEFSSSNRRVRSRITGRLVHRKQDDWGGGNSINFGLNDVQRKLETITAEIKSRTASAYAKISGRTLEQLLSTGDIDKSLGDELNINNLKVILARLGKSEAENKLSKLFESGDIHKDKNKYLKSFLGQMLEIYRETQAQEFAIEQFVSLVESYWRDNVEEKHLTYDKLSVKVNLVNVFTGDSLSLNNLSSGEKQMISIFARLYLNPGNKYIILIDEPELSLSIDWQRKFLVDISKSHACVQLVAITHSPHIFDNELDAYAGALNVSFTKERLI